MKRVVAIAVVVASLLFFLLFGFGRPKWLAPIPSNHDPRLIGVWDATWYKAYGERKRKLYFFGDGTANTLDLGFEWGTNNNEITLRYRWESWTNTSKTYRVDTATGEVAFSGKERWFFPARMVRDNPFDSIKTLPSRRGKKDFETALRLANERNDLVQGAFKQPDCGFVSGPEGSRQWILFPIATADQAYFVDFSTADGSVLVTKWVKRGAGVKKQWQVPLHRGMMWAKDKWNPETSLLSFFKQIMGDYLAPDESSPESEVAQAEFLKSDTFVSFEADSKTHQVIAAIHSENGNSIPQRYVDVVSDMIAVMPEELSFVEPLQ